MIYILLILIIVAILFPGFLKNSFKLILGIILLILIFYTFNSEGKSKSNFEEIGYYKEKTLIANNRVFSIYVRNFSDSPTLWQDIKDYAKNKMHSPGGSTIVYFFKDRSHTTQLSYSGDVIPVWDQPHCIAKYSNGILIKWPFNNEPINLFKTSKITTTKSYSEYFKVGNSIRNEILELTVDYTENISDPYFKTKSINQIVKQYLFLGNNQKAVELLEIAKSSSNRIDGLIKESVQKDIIKYFAEATKYDNAIRLANKINGALESTNSYLTISKIFFQNSDKDAAILFLNRALSRANDIEYSFIKIPTLAEIASYFALYSLNEDATRIIKKIINKIDNISLTANRSDALIFIGKAYAYMKNKEKAIEFLNKAINIVNSNDVEYMKAFDKMTISRVFYDDLGDNKSASIILNEALNEAINIENIMEYYDIKTVRLCQIAERYLEIEDKKKAKKALEIALSVNPKINGIKERAKSLAYIAEVYSFISKRKSKKLFKEALDISEKVPIKFYYYTKVFVFSRIAKAGFKIDDGIISI